MSGESMGPLLSPYQHPGDSPAAEAAGHRLLLPPQQRRLSEYRFAHMCMQYSHTHTCYSTSWKVKVLIFCSVPFLFINGFLPVFILSVISFLFSFSHSFQTC